jgi:DNA-directed RNA polymerase specialized sigma24 family protein
MTAMGLPRPAPPPTETELETKLEPELALHLRTLWRYLRMHGARPAEADDLAQDAFVIALQKGALGAQPAALATFLRRTARFLFLRRRKGGHPEALLADAVDALWARDCGKDAGEGMVAAARECIGRLEGRARRAVELGYGLDGAGPSSRSAIAAELGMQENGVKTLLQRTRQQLRECIEHKTGRRQP